jgi:hypothetical protein
MAHTSILHNLPLDVIRKHILPSLDWPSRVTANVLLDPADRLRFSLKKDAGISLMIAKDHNIIKKKVSAVTIYNSQEKNYEHIVDLMTSMNDMTYILKYSIGFRNMFISKCLGFADLESSEYAGSILSDEKKQFLSALCKKNLARLETIPYEREVASSCKDTWTAVTAGPPHIVQQTVSKVFNGYTHSYEEYVDAQWEAHWSRRED